MVLFGGKTCEDAEIVVSLQCVFHSIRFKVNKGLGPSGDPFFVISCRFQGIKKGLSGFTRLVKAWLIKNKVLPLQHESYPTAACHPSRCADRQF
jgi:hypothetical protein